VSHETPEVLGDWLESVNLTTRAHFSGSDQRMLTDICAGVYHNHARSQEVSKEIHLNRLVCAKKVNLSLNLVR